MILAFVCGSRSGRKPQRFPVPALFIPPKLTTYILSFHQITQHGGPRPQREHELLKHQGEQLLRMGHASILAGLLQPLPLIQCDLHLIKCQRGDFCTKCNAKNKPGALAATNLLPEDLSLVNSFLLSRKRPRSFKYLTRGACVFADMHAETGGFTSAKEAKERFALNKPKHHLILHI